MDESRLFLKVRRVIARVAIALSTGLLLLALVVATGGVIAGGGPWGWALVLPVTITVIATPLLLLGLSALRRASRLP